MPTNPLSPCPVRECVNEAIAGLPDLAPDRPSAIIDPRTPPVILCDRQTLTRLLVAIFTATERNTARPRRTLYVFESDDPHRSVVRFELHGIEPFEPPPELVSLALELGDGLQANRGQIVFTAVSNFVTPRLKATPATPNHRRLSILLVEDNKMNQKVAVEYLKVLGQTCDVADNGAAAVEMVQSRSYDLILMDIHMPELDGLSATRAIRAMETEHRSFIAALTAFALPGDRERCLAAGMDDFLTKPCRTSELAALINKIRR